MNDEPRILGEHAGCIGRVRYGVISGGAAGVRWCDECGMTSHGWWTNRLTGARRPPESPETVAERDARERRQ